jgi:hypothetical protein
MTNRLKLPTLSQIVHSPTLITVVGFFAGIFATMIFHTYVTEAMSDNVRVTWGIVAFLALMVSLAIILIAIVGQEALKNQKTILKEFDEKFGLKAQFVRDEGDSGYSYKRTQEYIENSHKDMIFVDSWVKCSSYDDTQPRIEYYRAIEKQIESMLGARHPGQDWTGDPFYHRIIQLPQGVQPSDITQDKVYAEHLKKCAKLQKNRKEIIRVDMAKPFTHINFGIIDDRYFVQTIMTTNGKLKRHGAIIFTDPEGELIKRYKAIIQHLQLTEIAESELEITESQLQTDQ